jgi:hypothetical protein
MKTSLLILLLCTQFLKSQQSILSSDLTISARACGNTGISEWQSYQFVMNPALLAIVENKLIHLESHNYYQVSGLFDFSLNTSLPFLNSGAGIKINANGSEDLREWLAGLSYGRKLNEKTCIGTSVYYLYTQTPESKDSKNICFEIGLQSQLIPDLMLACVIKNPLPIALADSKTYPSLFKFGFNYKIYEQFEILAEIHKSGIQALSLHTGLRYVPIAGIRILTGFSSLEPELSIGIEYKIKSNIYLNTAFAYHNNLGMSSSFGFHYLYR